MQSPTICYKSLREDSTRVGRLTIGEGEFIDIRHDGHKQLLICRLPLPFRREVLDKLNSGFGGRPKIDSSMVGELEFRLRQGVYIGDKVWVQCYFRGKFFCAFLLPGVVTAANLRWSPA